MRLRTLDIDQPRGAGGQADVAEALFSPDGRSLLTSSTGSPGESPQSRVWDLRTMRPATPQLTGGSARWEPDSQAVITTTTSGEAQIWDAAGEHLTTLHGGDSVAGPAQLSADGRYALTGSPDGTADVWDAVTGALLESLVGTHGGVTAAGFSADASRGLTFGADGSARIWSTAPGLPQPAPGPPSLRVSIEALGGDQNVARSSFDLLPDPLVPVAAMYKIVSGGPGAVQRGIVIDTRTGARISEFPFPAGKKITPYYTSNGYVAFDARGRVMLVLGNGPAQLRSVRTGGLLHTLTGAGSLAMNGAVSPDGTLAAAADGAGRIGVWDVATGRRLTSVDHHDAQQVPVATSTLKFSADGTLLLGADPNGLTFVWKARTGQVLNKITGPPPPQGGYNDMYDDTVGGAISPDDQLVVTTSGWDNDAHVYRVGQRRELIRLTGHSNGIDDASFSPDSTLIATTAGHGDCSSPGVGSVCDNSTRVWDTQQSSPLLTLTGDGGTRVGFSPDGNSLVVNSFIVDPVFPYETLSCDVCGGFDRLVPLAISAEVRGLTGEERARFLGG